MGTTTILNQKSWATRESKFILAIFLIATSLALFYGVRSSFFYSSKKIPVFWFHLSYHYLASAWTWIIFIPFLLRLKKSIKLSNRFLVLSVIIASPVSILHRSLTIFFDATFRWSMEYTVVNGWDALFRSKEQFILGLFDSFLVYFIIMISLQFFFYKISDVGSKETETIRSNHDQINLVWMGQILGRKKDRWHFVHLENVVLFKSFGNYIKIITKNEQLLKRETMKNLEKKLNPNHFSRVNRYHILNLNFIHTIEYKMEGIYHITMLNNQVIRTGKAYGRKVKELLNQIN